jgi:hypothetical protein
VVIRVPSWQDYLALSFDDVRQFAATSVQMVRRLYAVRLGFGDTIKMSDRRDAVLKYLDHLNRDFDRFNWTIRTRPRCNWKATTVLA